MQPREPAQARPGELASAARIYDRLLGGAHNFAVDRAAAQRLIEIFPDVRRVTWANRAFLRRVVTFLLQEGIDQFLDVGSGIPAVGSVHEIAAEINPAAHIVYVDTDPVVLQHGLAILQGHPSAAAIQADARQPRLILEHAEVQRLLDFRRPVAVLLVALLQFVPNDDEAVALVAEFKQALPSGGYLALAHPTPDGVPAVTLEQLERLYEGTTNPARARPRAQVERFFDGLEVVDPGVVFVPQWRPETDRDVFVHEPGRSSNVGGVGRKL